MKTLLTISFLVINIYALEITKQKSFITEISPTTQSSSFSLNHTAKKSDQIEKVFSKAITLVDKSTICKGGQYKIYPEFEYKNNQKTQIGYNSYINFNCKFSNSKEYEKLLQRIKKLDTKLTQNQISYEITPLENENQKTKLELKAYNYAKEYSGKLNTIFESCSTKSINFRDSHQAVQYRAMTASKDTTVTSPIAQDVEIKLNVEYVFECQN